MWGGGWLRVPYSELSIPFLLINSDMTAQLQQSSIYDWAQSQHQSAVRGIRVRNPLYHIFVLTGSAFR